MPKETIYSDTPYNAVEDDPPFEFAMQVGWQKDCDVQVGITTTGDRHLLEYMLHQGTVEQNIETMVRLGRSAANAMRDYPELVVALDIFLTSEEEDRFMFDVGCGISEHLRATNPDWKSLWWHPTRNQINKLIRLLRNARDSANGRDE